MAARGRAYGQRPPDLLAPPAGSGAGTPRSPTGGRPVDTFFSTEITDLPAATRPEVLELRDGEELRLRPGPVPKRIGDATVRMLGYNGSIPGPTLKVRQGSEAVVPGTTPRPHDRG